MFPPHSPSDRRTRRATARGARAVRRGPSRIVGRARLARRRLVECGGTDGRRTSRSRSVRGVGRPRCFDRSECVALRGRRRGSPRLRRGTSEGRRLRDRSVRIARRGGRRGRERGRGRRVDRRADRRGLPCRRCPGDRFLRAPRDPEHRLLRAGELLVAQFTSAVQSAEFVERERLRTAVLAAKGLAHRDDREPADHGEGEQSRERQGDSTEEVARIGLEDDGHPPRIADGRRGPRMTAPTRVDTRAATGARPARSGVEGPPRATDTGAVRRARRCAAGDVVLRRIARLRPSPSPRRSCSIRRPACPRPSPGR